MQIAEQETTDFEKALYSTRAPVTVALGMTGKALRPHARRARCGHTLCQPALGCLGRRGGCGAGADRPSFVQGAAGERVSIHPLAPVAFWRLGGAQISARCGTARARRAYRQSNEAPTGPFTIVPEEGVHAPYPLILPRTYLAPLIRAQLLLETA